MILDEEDTKTYNRQLAELAEEALPLIDHENEFTASELAPIWHITTRAVTNKLKSDPRFVCRKVRGDNGLQVTAYRKKEAL